MPATWDQVASNPKFQVLPSDQKIAASTQYFNDVVAPRVPKEHLAAAQQQFSTHVAETTPRTAWESTQARAGEALDQKPSGLASLIRTKVLGFDPITPVAKAAGVIAAPAGAAGEAATRSVGQAVGANPVKLEKAARDTGDVVGELTGILPGGKISKVAEDASAARQSSFVDRLIAPMRTAKVRTEQVGRTAEKGLNAKKVVEQTPREKAIASEVKNLPVSKYKSWQANYNIIQDANIAEAERLKAALIKNDVPVSLHDVQTAQTKAIQAAREDPSVATARGAAHTVILRFNNAILNVAQKTKGPLKASDLLQARKDFDASVKAAKPQAFNPAVENSVGVMTHHLRTALNDLIESKMPNEAYKKSLKKQNLLYEAMKNIKPKAANEADSLTGRVLVKPVTKALGYGLGGASVGAGYEAMKLGKDYFSQ